MYEIPVLANSSTTSAKSGTTGRLCSLPLKPSSACVRFSFRSRPPSVVGMTSFFRQASIIHCALAAVADHVRFQRVRAVVLLVPGDHRFDVLGRLEIVVGEDARPGREGPRADQLAGLDQVLVGEHVVRARLRVAAGGHAVGEVGEEAPVLHVEHAVADLGPVGMGVDEAGDDRLPGRRR